MADVRYGDNLCLRIDGVNGAATEVGVPRGAPLGDVGAATTAAISDPLDYPPLAQSTTPGDRVVLALERGVPQAAHIVAAVVDALVRSGVDPDGITVLRSPSDCDAGADDPRRLLDAALRAGIALTTHDPADRRQLAYLAADEGGEAILLNRALHDADLVLSIGCLHSEQSAGYYGIHNAIYPTFSDAKTLQRFCGPGTLNGRGDRKRELITDVDRVAWLLGVNFTIQAVPAGGEQVMHMLAGQPDAVWRRGRELYHAIWDCPIVDRADLVVAAVEGSAGQQTWENVGRALRVAGCFVEEDGAIAICCGVSTKPGPAIQHLAHAKSREAALKHIGHHRPVDALPAAQLASALDRSKVYLLSQLEPSLVEDLEMVPVEGPDELVRLVSHHRSCIFLSNAPYIVATGGHE
ncbi:MAG: lactate racemase domain-containing protein [Planctomycetaceae bacterium]|nr:lactate racemase domain-containing protein [Planctomycetaceae bacterium]